MAKSKSMARISRIVGARSPQSGFYPYEAKVLYKGIELICSAPLSIEMKIVELGGNLEEARPIFRDLLKSVRAVKAAINPMSSDYASLDTWDKSLTERLSVKQEKQPQVKQAREKVAARA